MTSLPPSDTVARFVLRARRIRAHSLVQDPEAFAKLLNTKATARITLDGTGTVRFPLPADEEVFESLAARVRPVTLKQESIFYPKVLSAIRRLLDASPLSTQQHSDQHAALNATWKTIKVEGQMQTYGMHASNPNNADTTGLVTDTELAAGWMYADLVHADTADWMEKTLAFSIGDRYLAAVNVFSRIAALAVDTLRFIEQLREAGALTLDEQAWTADVVLGASEIVQQATVYIAPTATGAPVPPESLDAPGSPWTRLTHPRQLHSVAVSQFHVELKAADGSTIAAHDAEVLNHTSNENVWAWRMLIATSLILHVELRPETDGTAQIASVNVASAAEDLRTLSTANAILRQVYRADTVVFNATDADTFEIPLPTPDPNEVLRQQRYTELLEDLVALEDLSGQPIGTPKRLPSPFQQVRIRQMRLFWSGKVAQTDRAFPHSVVSPDGATPRWAQLEPLVHEVCGIRIAIPQIRIGHREAIWHDEGPAPEAGPDARKFTVTLPHGVTRFLAWSPQTRATEPDNVPSEGEPWGLAGIDEDAWPY